LSPKLPLVCNVWSGQDGITFADLNVVNWAKFEPRENGGKEHLHLGNSELVTKAGMGTESKGHHIS